jgi:transcriptional regulator with XRE-family HTH domain
VSEDRRPSRTLAEKLDHLFTVVQPAGRGEYTYEEVADAIAAEGGPTISSSYLWLLRKGRRDNPTVHHIEALAQFFAVPAAYFFDDEAAESVDAQLKWLAAMRDDGIRGVALRSAPLSAASVAAIADLVEHLRTLEGILPEERGL